MHLQPRLWGPAQETHLDVGLFDECDAVFSSGLVCQECDRPLVMTSSGFWACDAGHGKLIEPVCEMSPAGFWESLEDEQP